MPASATGPRRPGGRLVLRGLILQRFWPARPPPAAAGDQAQPLAGFELASPDAQLQLEGCTLFAPLSLAALQAASPFWAAAAAANGSGGGGTRVVVIDRTASGVGSGGGQGARGPRGRAPRGADAPDIAPARRRCSSPRSRRPPVSPARRSHHFALAAAAGPHPLLPGARRARI
jgi:hypothetical protein